MKLHKLVVDNADQTKEHEHAFLIWCAVLQSNNVRCIFINNLAKIINTLVYKMGLGPLTVSIEARFVNFSSQKP